MLSSHAVPVGQGLVVFILLAAAPRLPHVIWSYRRYNHVSPRRVLAQSLFLLYLLCAWALVLLPFPDPAVLVRVFNVALTVPSSGSQRPGWC